MLTLDSKDMDQLRRAFEQLPGQIKTKVMAKAMRQLRSQARKRIVNDASAYTNMPKQMVNDLTRAYFNAGGNTQAVVVESGWIHLYKLGAVQNARGTYVHHRGQYNHAFVAGFKSGHVGVFGRVQGTQMPSAPKSIRHPERLVKRQQLRELFGANPAHAITNNPERYLEVMAEIVQEKLAPAFEAAVSSALNTRRG